MHATLFTGNTQTHFYNFLFNFRKEVVSTKHLKGVLATQQEEKQIYRNIAEKTIS